MVSTQIEKGIERVNNDNASWSVSRRHVFSFYLAIQGMWLSVVAHSNGKMGLAGQHICLERYDVAHLHAFLISHGCVGAVCIFGYFVFFHRLAAMLEIVVIVESYLGKHVVGKQTVPFRISFLVIRCRLDVDHHSAIPL